VAKQAQNLGEIYAERAMAGPGQPVSTISIPRIREARDMVYSGTTPPQTERSDETVNVPSSPKNRKTSRRKVSPFNVIVILFGVAVISVLYISNILAVGRLVIQIDQLQKQHQQLTNDQELLKAQVNRLSALDRVQQIAQDQLGLRSPKQIPMWIAIDPERIQRIEEVVQSHMHKNP
jgi:cell division protein FtsL